MQVDRCGISVSLKSIEEIMLILREGRPKMLEFWEFRGSAGVVHVW